MSRPPPELVIDGRFLVEDTAAVLGGRITRDATAGDGEVATVEKAATDVARISRSSLSVRKQAYLICWRVMSGRLCSRSAAAVIKLHCISCPLIFTLAWYVLPPSSGRFGIMKTAPLL